MRGLYAIVDVDALRNTPISVVDFASAVLAARPAALQLRAKHEAPRDVVALLRRLRPLCTAAGVPLFANDRPDLAVLGACDGVHVGQDDLAVADVRRFAPALRVGVSTHDDSQLVAALADRPDYAAFGPVFPTASKADPSPIVGEAALARASAACRAAGIPLVAIGGIHAVNAARVAPHADMAAVIGALIASDAEQVTARAMELARLLGGGTALRG